MKRVIKLFLYPLEALLILILVCVGRIIGIDKASELGAFLTRKIGLSKKNNGIILYKYQKALLG